MDYATERYEVIIEWDAISVSPGIGAEELRRVILEAFPATRKLWRVLTVEAC